MHRSKVLVPSLFAVASAVLGAAPPAFAGGPVVCHNEIRNVYCRGPHGRIWVCGHRVVRVCTGGCAPAVESANIGAVQASLEALAASPDFATATKFRAKVKALAAETDSEVKFGEYLELVGFPADATTDELMAFLGARTPDPRSIASLETNLDLNAEQAAQIVSAVATALRGNLR